MSAVDVRTAFGDGREIVTKNGLCAVLGWGRDRLDRRLAHDPDFPIEKRGDAGKRGSIWEFDVAKVKAHLRRDAESEPALITPRGRRELAQAQKIEDQLRVTRAELVETGPFRSVLAQAFQIWATHDSSASDTIASRLNLDEDETVIVREILDDRRRELVQALRDFTNEDTDDDDDEEG